VRFIRIDHRALWTGIELSVLGGVAIFVGSLAAGWLGVAPNLLFAVLITVAFCATMATWIRTGSMSLGLLALAWSALAVAWFTWARTGNPWSAHAITVLICSVIVLGPAGAFIVGRWSKDMDRYAAGELARINALERRRYEQIFAQLNHPVTVTDVDEDRSGTLVKIKLPSDGKTTIAVLDGIARGVEVALKAKPMSVRFEVGAHAGEVVMRRSEKDVLAQPVHLPADYGPLTINERLRIGTHENGLPYAALLREVATLAVGERGSGKSNLANVFISQLARCIDVLIFVIDLKGGRMARPWVAPWALNPTVIKRPAVDWVATTREEAHLMLTACVAGIDARSYSGHGGEKLTPDRQHPAILLLCDEIAVMFDPRRGPKIPLDPHAPPVVTNPMLANLGTDMTERGRSEAIDPILFALRAVADKTGGTDIKAQARFRIGLQCASEAEARYILEDDVRMGKILAAMKHPGSAVVQDPHTGPHVIKVDRVEHERIAEIAAATWSLRPDPDPVLAEAMGKAWADRWTPERAGAWLDSLRAEPSREGIALTVASDAGRTEALFKELVGQGVLGADPEERLDERHRRMRTLIWNATGAVSPNWLMRLFEQEAREGGPQAPARAVLHRWLKADVAEGVIRRAGFGLYERPRADGRRAA
jgi:hypothetical protein